MSDQLWFSIKMRNTVGPVELPVVLDPLEVLLVVEPPVPALELELVVPVAPPEPPVCDPPHAAGSVAATMSAAPKDAE
jgi:hypothetical protein